MIRPGRIFARLRNALRRLPMAREGAAAVEFALIVPFLIVLYLGSIEISDLIAVDRRVTVISGTMGDLVARSDGVITTATLNTYFNAADGIILPYTEVGLQQVVSLVYVNPAGATSVVWSRGHNGGTAKVAGTPYAIPTSMSDISRNNWVIVSETSFAYRPLLGFVVSSAINLHRVSYYLPRHGTVINLT